MNPQIPEKTCFVVAPIGKDGSDIREHSNQVLEYIVKPAMAECGYKAIRADEISNPGIITTDIIQHIINDPLVVAVLSYHNPNVFYELAVRHAIRKPVIQLIFADETIPFDVHQNRTIQYRLDLPGAKAAKEEIIKQVSAVNQNEETFDNPISVAIDLQVLRQSKDPLAQSSAEIISILQGLTQQINILQRGLATSDNSKTFRNITTLLSLLIGRTETETEVLKWYLTESNSVSDEKLEAIYQALELALERESIKRSQRAAEKPEETKPNNDG